VPVVAELSFARDPSITCPLKPEVRISDEDFVLRMTAIGPVS
jgi:hypothetical protein